MREVLLKLIVYFFIILIMYALLIILSKLIRIDNSSFNLNIVEKMICSNEFENENYLNIPILINELALENKLIKKNYDAEVMVNKNDSQGLDIKNDSSQITQEKEDYLSYDNIKPQNRPSKYETQILPSGKIQVGKAYINNYSNIELNLDELSTVSNFKIKDGTSILIYHTHTSEAYEEIGINDNFRSTNDAYNVVAVGETLKENLLLKKFDVFHSTTKHDTPSYNGAYNASLETAQNILKEKKYDILIDLHRDALSGNLHFRPTTQINGETAAKIMFVIGTNASGLDHDGWMNNLKLALLIQNTAEEMYPGLFRDINLAKYRYNQHLSDGAFILEVGSTGNTLSDTKTAMKYLANVLEALK